MKSITLFTQGSVIRHHAHGSRPDDDRRFLFNLFSGHLFLYPPGYAKVQTVFFFTSAAVQPNPRMAGAERNGLLCLLLFAAILQRNPSSPSFLRGDTSKESEKTNSSCFPLHSRNVRAIWQIDCNAKHGISSADSVGTAECSLILNIPMS